MHVIKIASKKGGFSETERFIELWHEEKSLFRKNILSENYKPGKKRKKVLEECRKTRNDKELIISLKCFFESSFFE